MQLTEADKQKIADWINDKCGLLRCICCGMSQWTLLDGATIQIGFNLHTTRFHYHEGIPMVSIACTRCGYMLFFNAGVIGFTPDPPPLAEVPEVPKEDPEFKIEGVTEADQGHGGVDRQGNGG